jgi:hypothetical protein
MGMIQIAKDSFYLVLRDRIATANPARTMVLRGLLRPAVLTVENELPGVGLEAMLPAEAFCLRWTTLTSDGPPMGQTTALMTLGCEISYASEGSTGAGGMDRGRALAAMDTVLLAALSATPMGTPAISVTEGTGGGVSAFTGLGWNIFWGSPRPQPTVVKAERLQRVVDVEVFCYGQ